MSYLVLARKWRPRNFQTIVGQEHVLQMLTNALNHQRLHHAYLFTGTHGTGKTTTARIFAKSLNCETGITSTPCDQCQNCLAIDTGKFLDLIEIDAASRTKVEDTRELLDNVHYAPNQGRFKVYLIDEVHMLSGHSFNALLKTLEEPPCHVKFLLATTDPDRLPMTVLSRCLQFQLKRVPVEQIEAHLTHVCTAEQITFETPALHLLATAAKGSLRDALSLLDQTIAFCNQQITTKATKDMLGTLDHHIIYPLLAALSQHNGKQLMEAVNHLAQYTADFDHALEELLTILHQINMAQMITDLPTDELLQPFVSAFSPEEIQLYYQIALIGRRDLPLAATPQQGFEMMMLRMLAFCPASTSGSMTTPPTTAKTPITTTVNTTETLQSESNNISLKWSDILPKLKLTGLAQALASNCTLETISDNKITLALAANHEPMFNKKLVERIEQAISQYFNKPMTLAVEITNQDLYTPAKQQQQVKQAQRDRAAETIQNDTQVQKIIDIFDAKLDVDSIKAVE